MPTIELASNQVYVYKAYLSCGLKTRRDSVQILPYLLTNTVSCGACCMHIRVEENTIKLSREHFCGHLQMLPSLLTSIPMKMSRSIIIMV